jgi:basic amino acid/polyamine antiporter, APA family
VNTENPAKPTLKRRLNLPLLVLYGLGVTVGAGIYVLVGATASKAGYYAPVSFLLAAFVVTLTGFSYAEFATRYPVSAGEAAYVREGLNIPHLSTLVGLMVIASGVVSSAAISLGTAAYLHNVIPLHEDFLLACIIILIGVIAFWGIFESVFIAAVVTLIELGGLVLVVFFGFNVKPDLLENFNSLIPPFEIAAWSGIGAAGLLAFFAYVGFEDIANVAEEVKEPRKTMPRGIFLTVIIATVIYIAVVSVVVLVVPMTDLVNSNAPLALIFNAAPPWFGTLFSGIGFLATINGALIQVIMASRVIYGLSSQGSLPQFLSVINSRTRTPQYATLIVVIIICTLAYFLPIADLAETTSTLVLTVFSLVNLALIRLKWKKRGLQDKSAFSAPVWVPYLGFVSCLGLLAAGFWV